MTAPEQFVWKGSAVRENLDGLQALVGQRLEAAGVPLKTRLQLAVAVEEVFVNIASYAYAPGTGDAAVSVEVSGAPKTVTVTFADRGRPYDPLARGDPDVTLGAEAREIGGLGIFMTKKLTDELRYEYRDGQNVLTLKKRL